MQSVEFLHCTWLFSTSKKGIFFSSDKMMWSIQKRRGFRGSANFEWKNETYVNEFSDDVSYARVGRTSSHNLGIRHFFYLLDLLKSISIFKQCLPNSKKIELKCKTIWNWILTIVNSHMILEWFWVPECSVTYFTFKLSLDGSLLRIIIIWRNDCIYILILI